MINKMNREKNPALKDIIENIKEIPYVPVTSDLFLLNEYRRIRRRRRILFCVMVAIVILFSFLIILDLINRGK